MKNAAILMGGYSGESEVSIKSGDFIFEHINKEFFKPIKTFIYPDEWYVLIENKKKSIDKGRFGFDSEYGFQPLHVAYNTIHGVPGENGYIQAYLDLIGVHYTGCNSYVSALTFNKVDCNIILNKYGITTANSMVYRKKDKNHIHYAKLKEVVGDTFMVKAARSGSSIGVSRVDKEADLQAALDNAFKIDDSVLIESFIQGTEVSVGVYRDEKNIIQVLELTEIISKNDFFDYRAKYLGESEEITPARMDEKTREKVKNLTAYIYEIMGIEGIARIDFIIQNHTPYFIEINTNPGMSPQSIFPQQAAFANIDLVHLFTSQLQQAENKKLL